MKEIKNATPNASAENSRHHAAAAPASAKETVEVLYQKMGDRWFAFSLVNDEVFVGSITQQELDALENGQHPAAPVHALVGNS